MFPKPCRVINRKLLDEVPLQGCYIGQDCYGKIVAHHLNTVGAGGDDIVDNLVPLCRKHHTEIHWGLSKFVENHPKFLNWLQAHNRWDLIDKIQASF